MRSRRDDDRSSRAGRWASLPTPTRLARNGEVEIARCGLAGSQGEPLLLRSTCMPVNYARIVRRSAMVMAAVGAVMIALGAGIGGSKGLLGAVIGLAIVAAFFAISAIAVGTAARVSPQAMMATALASYLVKILALIILAGRLQGSAAFNGRIFGLTAIGCVLAYSTAQMIWSIRLKVPYVGPDRKR